MNHSYHSLSGKNCRFFIIMFFINMHVQGHHPHQWAPSRLWLAARIAVLTPDLLGVGCLELPPTAVVLSQFFNIILDISGLRLPSISISHVVLTALLDSRALTSLFGNGAWAHGIGKISGVRLKFGKSISSICKRFPLLD